MCCVNSPGNRHPGQTTEYYCLINYVCIKHTVTITEQRSQTTTSPDKIPLETWIFAPVSHAVLSCAYWRTDKGRSLLKHLRQFDNSELISNMEQSATTQEVQTKHLRQCFEIHVFLLWSFWPRVSKQWKEVLGTVGMTKIDVSQSPPVSTLISSLHPNLSTSFKSFSDTKVIMCFITTNISVKRLSRRLEGKTRSTLESGEGRNVQLEGEIHSFLSRDINNFFLGIKSSFLCS
jgi:hypothetical protein